MFWGFGRFGAGMFCIRSFCSGTFCLGPFCRSTQEQTDLSGLNQDSSSWLAVKAPLSASLGRLTYTYYLLFIYHIFCILTWFSFFLCSVKHSIQVLVSGLFQFSSIIQSLFPSLFDYCLILVQYSDPGNVFQVFWSHYLQHFPIQ